MRLAARNKGQMALHPASSLIWAGRVFTKPWLSAPGVDTPFRSSSFKPPQTFPAATQGMLLRVRTTAFLSGAAIAGAVAVFKLRQDFLDSQQVLLDQVRQSDTQSLSGLGSP